jgi:NDP-sugar pyrophosphorylase family protein
MMRAVILAGGRGTRLAPYTKVLPKPLMPVGEQAILEILVDQLREAGFKDLTFCVGYLSHLIRALFGSGADRGVTITYVREPEPLGTAGPLRLVERLDDTFLAMNGDVLTTLDYRDLVRCHREAGNVLTIATHQRATTIDYGIVHLDTEASPDRVACYVEKPEFSLLVSMGVYVIEPAALEHVPENVHFDVPTLIQGLLEVGSPVGIYPHDGFWLDIGRHEDFEQATALWQEYGSSPLQRLSA